MFSYKSLPLRVCDLVFRCHTKRKLNHSVFLLTRFEYTHVWLDYDFSGGGFVKFGFSMAFTTTVLAWGLVDHEGGYTAAGTYMHMTEVTNAYVLLFSLLNQRVGKIHPRRGHKCPQEE